MGEGKILGLLVDRSRTMSHHWKIVVEKVWSEGVSGKIIHVGTDSIAVSSSKISFRVVSTLVS